MFQKVIHFMILGLLIFMFAFLTISFFYPDLLLPVIEWIKEKIIFLGKWNILLAFLSALFESLPIIGSIIPGQVILLSVGGFYGSIGTKEFLSVLFAAIGGSIVSNAIGYYIGKYYGEDFFKKYGMWVGIEKTELKYLKKGVDTWGPIGIILSKFHAQFRAFLPFIAGSMGFHKGKFWFYNIIGSCLWAIVFVSIGIYFAENYEVILKYIGYIMSGILIIIAGFFWFFRKEAVLKYWEEKKSEMEAKYPS